MHLLIYVTKSLRVQHSVLRGKEKLTSGKTNLLKPTVRETSEGTTSNDYDANFRTSQRMPQGRVDASFME